MATFLMIWNETEYSLDQYQEYFDEYKRGDMNQWSCGVTTKKIQVGDSFYLMKTGLNGGIVGSGVIKSIPYSDAHYVSSRAKAGDKANYVQVKHDYLINPITSNIPITRIELNSNEKLADNVWKSQGSGKTIPENITVELDKIWKARVELEDFSSPDEEKDCDGVLSEGSVKKVLVNAYERNPELRRKCIEKWGYSCSVCNFHFQMFYGELGRNYIHIHHLKPLSSIKEKHDVDPVDDLRPVCPNCHAMLHRQTPPLSIKELRDKIDRL
jgi:5-methylcytosine-specific restriction protein A